MKKIISAIILMTVVGACWGQEALARKYNGKSIPVAELNAWRATLPAEVDTAIRATAQRLTYNANGVDSASAEYNVGRPATYEDLRVTGWTADNKINCQDYSVLFLRYVSKWAKENNRKVYIIYSKEDNHDWIWIEGIGHIEPQVGEYLYYRYDNGRAPTTWNLVVNFSGKPNFIDTDWAVRYSWRLMGDIRWSEYWATVSNRSGEIRYTDNTAQQTTTSSTAPRRTVTEERVARANVKEYYSRDELSKMTGAQIRAIMTRISDNELNRSCFLIGGVLVENTKYDVYRDLYSHLDYELFRH